MTEVLAKPGDGIGKPDPGFAMADTAAFTVVEIIDKSHVKVRVSTDLVFRDAENRDAGKTEVILRAGDKLAVTTNTDDAGIEYTLRISDLDQVPVVKADDPKLIAAISAHANVTVDEVGSIQEIGPPGVVALVSMANLVAIWAGETASIPRSSPTDEDMKKIGQFNDLRRLILTGCAITDAGAAHLKNLTRLRELDLSGTKIGDATLPYLAGMKELQSLNLSGTDISDKGVKLLLGMRFPKLKPLPGRNMPAVVHIEYTKITREGFWQLLLASPPWFRGHDNDGYLWGSLKKADGTTIWPKRLAAAQSEREKTFFRLLLLGCSLDADEEGADCRRRPDDDRSNDQVPVLSHERADAGGLRPVGKIGHGQATHD